jgi:hypothetical protein
VAYFVAKSRAPCHSISSRTNTQPLQKNDFNIGHRSNSRVDRAKLGHQTSYVPSRRMDTLSYDVLIFSSSRSTKDHVLGAETDERVVYNPKK